MSLTSACFTDIGQQRSVNQDNVFADEKGDYGIYVVSDGMGGHSKGEMASGKAVEMIGDWWKRNYTILKNSSIEEITNIISELIQNINAEILAMYQEQKLTGGATLSMLVIRDTSYLLFTIGDSRVFEIKKKKIQQISVDDVWESMAVNRYKTEAELTADPRYGTLTQAIGFEDGIAPRISGGSIEKQTQFFLCSDGIYKYCPEKVLYKLLIKGEKKRDLSETLTAIKERVYGYGALDNLTGILVRV